MASPTLKKNMICVVFALIVYALYADDSAMTESSVLKFFDAIITFILEMMMLMIEVLYVLLPLFDPCLDPDPSMMSFLECLSS